MWLTKKETAEKAESVKTGVVTSGRAGRFPSARSWSAVHRL